MRTLTPCRLAPLVDSYPPCPQLTGAFLVDVVSKARYREHRGPGAGGCSAFDGSDTMIMQAMSYGWPASRGVPDACMIKTDAGGARFRSG
jgi:hypothetical protein